MWEHSSNIQAIFRRRTTKTKPAIAEDGFIPGLLKLI